MNLDPVKNFAKVEVSTGYDSTATSIALVTGDGSKLPDPSTDGAFNLIWWNSTDYPDPADDPNVEIVRCTARSGDTLTIIRGQEGTTASNKNTTGKTYKMVLSVTKKMIDDIGAGAWTLIETLSPSGVNSITTTASLSGYNALKVIIAAKASNVSYVGMRFSGDTGTNYYYQCSMLTTVGTFTQTTAATSLEIGQIETYGTLFTVEISNVSGFRKSFLSNCAYATVTQYRYSGAWNNVTGQITSLTFFLKDDPTYTFASGSKIIILGI